MTGGNYVRAITQKTQADESARVTSFGMRYNLPNYIVPARGKWTYAYGEALHVLVPEYTPVREVVVPSYFDVTPDEETEYYGDDWFLAHARRYRGGFDGDFYWDSTNHRLGTIIPDGDDGTLRRRRNIWLSTLSEVEEDSGTGTGLYWTAAPGILNFPNLTEADGKYKQGDTVTDRLERFTSDYAGPWTITGVDPVAGTITLVGDHVSDIAGGSPLTVTDSTDLDGVYIVLSAVLSAGDTVVTTTTTITGSTADGTAQIRSEILLAPGKVAPSMGDGSEVSHTILWYKDVGSTSSLVWAIDGPIADLPLGAEVTITGTSDPGTTTIEDIVYHSSDDITIFSGYSAYYVPAGDRTGTGGTAAYTPPDYPGTILASWSPLDPAVRESGENIILDGDETDTLERYMRVQVIPDLYSYEDVEQSAIGVVDEIVYDSEDDVTRVWLSGPGSGIIPVSSDLRYGPSSAAQDPTADIVIPDPDWKTHHETLGAYYDPATDQAVLAESVARNANFWVDGMPVALVDSYEIAMHHCRLATKYIPSGCAFCRWSGVGLDLDVFYRDTSGALWRGTIAATAEIDGAAESSTWAQPAGTAKFRSAAYSSPEELDCDGWLTWNPYAGFKRLSMRAEWDTVVPHYTTTPVAEFNFS